MCQNFRRKWTPPPVTSNLLSRKTYSLALRDTSILSVLEPTADLKVGTKVWKINWKKKKDPWEINSYSGVNNFQKTFVSWLSERSYIAEMVENGSRVWEEMTFFSLNMTLPAWTVFLENVFYEEKNKLIKPMKQTVSLCLTCSVYFHDNPVITKKPHQVCIYQLCFY